MRQRTRGEADLRRIYQTKSTEKGRRSLRDALKRNGKWCPVCTVYVFLLFDCSFIDILLKWDMARKLCIHFILVWWSFLLSVNFLFLFLYDYYYLDTRRSLQNRLEDAWGTGCYENIRRDEQ